MGAIGYTAMVAHASRRPPRRATAQIISYERFGAGLPEFAMRLNGNFHFEPTSGRRENFRHNVLLAVGAGGVGATARAAVILSLVGSVMLQPRAPSISPRVIASNASSEAANTAQDRSAIETPARLAAVGPLSDPDAPVVQTEGEGQREPQSHQSRKKHNRVVVRRRESDWRRRFTRTSSQSQRFSSW